MLIPDACKSAGTLLCIGANKLIFGDRGELGPLDIQLSKPDEMFESMSGLDIIQALNAIENQLLRSFKRYLLDIRGGSRIRTKLAADIASKLADGYVAPIAAKIDPVTLGEHQRAMQIALEYGERLNQTAKSLKPNALDRLIAAYPSHGFVIDRKEAGELFNNVESPTEEQHEIYVWAQDLAQRVPMPDPIWVIDVTKSMVEQSEANEQGDEQHNENTESSEPTGSEEDREADGQSVSESSSDQRNGGEPEQPQE